MADKLSVQQLSTLNAYLKKHPNAKREDAIKLLFDNSAKKQTGKGVKVEHNKSNKKQTITLKSGLSVDVAKGASVETKEGIITLSKTGRYSVTGKDGKTKYYAANGTELNEKYFKQIESSTGNVTVKNSKGVTVDVNKRLQNRIARASKALKHEEDNQGLIGKLWSGAKNTFGFGDSSDKVQQQLKQEQKLLKQFNQQPQNRAKIFKQLTGLEYNTKNMQDFVEGKIQLKSEQKLDAYKEGQATAVDVATDVVSGIASFAVYSAAVAAAPFTGGASIAAGVVLAGVVGAGTKVALKAGETVGTDKKYDSLGHDLIMGAANGAISTVTAGLGGAVAKSLATRMGLEVVKAGAKEVAKQGTKQVVSQATKQAAKTGFKRAFSSAMKGAKEGLINPGGYKYVAKDGVKNAGLKKFGAYMAEGATDGSLSGGAISGVETAHNGGSAEDVLKATAFGTLSGAVMGGVMNYGMNEGTSAVGKLFKGKAKTTTEVAADAVETSVTKNADGSLATGGSKSINGVDDATPTPKPQGAVSGAISQTEHALTASELQAIQKSIKQLPFMTVIEDRPAFYNEIIQKIQAAVTKNANGDMKLIQSRISKIDVTNCKSYIVRNAKNIDIILDNAKEINEIYDNICDEFVWTSNDVIMGINKDNFQEVLKASRLVKKGDQDAINYLYYVDYSQNPHTVKYGDTTVEVDTQDIIALLSTRKAYDSEKFDREISKLFSINVDMQEKKAYGKSFAGIIEQKPELLEIAEKTKHMSEKEYREYINNLFAENKLDKNLTFRTFEPDDVSVEATTAVGAYFHMRKHPELSKNVSVKETIQDSTSKAQGAKSEFAPTQKAINQPKIHSEQLVVETPQVMKSPNISNNIYNIFAKVRTFLNSPVKSHDIVKVDDLKFDMYKCNKEEKNTVIKAFHENEDFINFLKNKSILGTSNSNFSAEIRNISTDSKVPEYRILLNDKSNPDIKHAIDFKINEYGKIDVYQVIKSKKLDDGPLASVTKVYSNNNNGYTNIVGNAYDDGIIEIAYNENNQIIRKIDITESDVRRGESEITAAQLDNDGNLIENKIGTVKVYTKADENGNHQVIHARKRVENPDGSISRQIKVFGKDRHGTVYKILDKDGNVQLDVKRGQWKIDENHYRSSHNGERFDIKYENDGITVSMVEGTGSKERLIKPIKISFDELNPQLLDLYKQLPGDYLYKLKLMGVKVKYEPKVKFSEGLNDRSCYVSAQKTIYISERSKNNPHTLAHEFSHAIDDYLGLMSNPEYLSLSKQEWEEFSKKAGITERQYTAYYTQNLKPSDYNPDAELVAGVGQIISGFSDTEATEYISDAILFQNYAKTIAYVGKKLDMPIEEFAKAGKKNKLFFSTAPTPESSEVIKAHSAPTPKPQGAKSEFAATQKLYFKDTEINANIKPLIHKENLISSEELKTQLIDIGVRKDKTPFLMKNFEDVDGNISQDVVNIITSDKEFFNKALFVRPDLLVQSLRAMKNTEGYFIKDAINYVQKEIAEGKNFHSATVALSQIKKEMGNIDANSIKIYNDIVSKFKENKGKVIDLIIKAKSSEQSEIIDKLALLQAKPNFKDIVTTLKSITKDKKISLELINDAESLTANVDKYTHWKLTDYLKETESEFNYDDAMLAARIIKEGQIEVPKQIDLCLTYLKLTENQNIVNLPIKDFELLTDTLGYSAKYKDMAMNLYKKCQNNGMSKEQYFDLLAKNKENLEYLRFDEIQDILINQSDKKLKIVKNPASEKFFSLEENITDNTDKAGIAYNYVINEDDTITYLNKETTYIKRGNSIIEVEYPNKTIKRLYNDGALDLSQLSNVTLEEVLDSNGKRISRTLSKPSKRNPGVIVTLKEIYDNTGNVAEVQEIGKLTYHGSKKQGLKVQRRYTSPSGVDSTHTIVQGPKGTYSKFEANGVGITRKFKKFANNETVTRVNGETYTSKFSENKIEITRKTQDGRIETAVLDSDLLDFDLLDLYKQLPGDYLFKLKEYGIKVKLGYEANNAAFSPVAKTILISEERKNNPFTFAHEFGHAMDFVAFNNLSANKELREVFEKELYKFNSERTTTERNIIGYFINKTIDANSELQELIAEVNAITSGLLHDSDVHLQRAKILQENFPETTAFIINKFKTMDVESSIEENLKQAALHFDDNVVVSDVAKVSHSAPTQKAQGVKVSKPHADDLDDIFDGIIDESVEKVAPSPAKTGGFTIKPVPKKPKTEIEILRDSIYAPKSDNSYKIATEVFSPKEIEEVLPQVKTQNELDIIKEKLSNIFKNSNPDEYERLRSVKKLVDAKEDEFAAKCYTHMDERVDDQIAPNSDDFKRIITQQIKDADNMEELKHLQKDFNLYKGGLRDTLKKWDDVESILKQKMDFVALSGRKQKIMDAKSLKEVMTDSSNPELNKLITAKRKEITAKLNTAYDEFKAGKSIPSPDEMEEIMMIKVKDCIAVDDLAQFKADIKMYDKKSSVKAGRAWSIVNDKELEIRRGVLSDFAKRLKSCNTEEEFKALKKEFRTYKKSDNYYSDLQKAANAARKGNYDLGFAIYNDYERVNKMFASKQETFKTPKPDAVENADYDVYTNSKGFTLKIPKKHKN